MFQLALMAGLSLLVQDTPPQKLKPPPKQKELPFGELIPVAPPKTADAVGEMKLDIPVTGTSLVSATNSDAGQFWITPSMGYSQSQRDPNSDTFGSTTYNYTFITVINPDRAKEVLVQYECWFHDGTSLGAPQRRTVAPLVTDMWLPPLPSGWGGTGRNVWCTLQASAPVIAHGYQTQRSDRDQDSSQSSIIRFYKSAQ